MNRMACLTVLAALLMTPEADASAVGKGERDLIAIVNLSLMKKFKLNYQYEEGRAVRKIRRELGREYRKIRVLKNKEATHDGFLRALAEAEADPSVKAIDVIIYLHGQPGSIGFVDTGFYPMDRLRDEILSLPSSTGGSPRKLRALYSDACYGESHIDDWLRAGFQVASGSVGVDANWSMDLKKFMLAWRKGKSFGYGIARANTVWSTGLMDWVAGGNSEKVVAGALEFTIDQPLAHAAEALYP